jgi:UDP-glucose 4-epimerase
VTVAVTGAGGYLGSTLMARLAGQPARALVRSPVEWVTGEQAVVDLLDPVEKVAAALEGCDTVIHLAGHNEVTAAEDPDRALAETIVAGRHVVDAAQQVGARRVVYVSTVHVYGAQLAPGACVTEATAPLPRSAYAIARLAVENLTECGPDPVVLRLTNAVGAPTHPDVDRWTLVASDLCRSAAEHGELVLHSTGQQWRDFIALDDVARTVLAATDVERVPAGIYNLASGTPMTVRSLAELVQDRVEARTGIRPPLRAPEPTAPGPEPYRVDTTRLRDLALEARTPVADAIDDLLEVCFSSFTSGGKQ